MLTFKSQKKREIHQIDSSNSFLQGNLERDVNVSVILHLEGVGTDKVRFLRKSHYGLRKGPRIW